MSLLYKFVALHDSHQSYCNVIHWLFSGNPITELLQGKYVVLFFYPLDFTFVCPTEITAFSDRHADFAKLNCEVCFTCL